MTPIRCITRFRNFLLYIGVTAVSVFASELVETPVDPLPAVAGAKPRSVVFILSDDHRYDAMGFMGHPFLETPGMDRIAAEGAHLKNAFVTTSLCSPSRASILTGLYTNKHRVIDNNRMVPPGTIFFPQYLQKAGYATAFFGKWHMGGDSDMPRPGFDRWVSFRGQGQYLPTGNTLNVDGKPVPQEGYITDEITEYALDWLRQQSPGERPFFMYLSHKGVHANFTPAERHQGRYANAEYTKPDSQADSRENRAGKPRWTRDQRNSWHGVDFPYHSDLDIEKYYKRYCETLLSVDDSIVSVLEELESMGILDETLVIYMGDNGFHFGEQGLIDKRVSYETSIRVPMIMRCPAIFKGGTVVEEVVANIDIAPTVFDAAGLQPPDHFDGASFLPLARGDDVDWRDAFLYVYYWEKNFPHTPTQFAVRTDQYKYITYYGLWDTDELYDLHADPGEKVNLIHQPEYAETARGLEDRLYAMLDEKGGLEIPLNQPRGTSSNKRLGPRGGARAADFPPEFVLPEPENRNAR